MLHQTRAGSHPAAASFEAAQRERMHPLNPRRAAEIAAFTQRIRTAGLSGASPRADRAAASTAIADASMRSRHHNGRRACLSANSVAPIVAATAPTPPDPPAGSAQAARAVEMGEFTAIFPADRREARTSPTSRARTSPISRRSTACAIPGTGHDTPSTATASRA